MSMVTEDYVSLETAKLLNPKGFNGEFHKHYWGYNSGKEFLTEGSFNPEYDYPAPTHQIARKWLREVHNINIVIDFEVKDGKFSYNYKVYKGVWVTYERDGFPTYEEASDSAIRDALNNVWRI